MSGEAKQELNEQQKVARQEMLQQAKQQEKQIWLFVLNYDIQA